MAAAKKKLAKSPKSAKSPKPATLPGVKKKRGASAPKMSGY